MLGMRSGTEIPPERSHQICGGGNRTGYRKSSLGALPRMRMAREVRSGGWRPSRKEERPHKCGREPCLRHQLHLRTCHSRSGTASVPGNAARAPQAEGSGGAGTSTRAASTASLGENGAWHASGSYPGGCDRRQGSTSWDTWGRGEQRRSPSLGRQRCPLAAQLH